MAATVSQPSFGLQAPVSDDTMEISSDFGAMDGDIDIDLDSAGEQTHYQDQDQEQQQQQQDDDRMVDDSYSDHDDDVMLDGDTTSNQGDREMQDDVHAQQPEHHDEDLLDFSEDEDIYADDAPLDPPDVQITEPPVDEPAPPGEEPEEQVQSETATELLTEGVDVVDNTAEEPEHEHEHLEEEQPASTTLPEDQAQPVNLQEFEENPLDHTEHPHVGSDAQPSERNATNSQDAVQNASEGETAQPETAKSKDATVKHEDQTGQRHDVDAAAKNSAREDPSEAADQSNVASGDADSESDPTHAQSTALTVDTEAATSADTGNPASPRTQRPTSPTVTGMHPTIVEYQGEDIFLFPPRKPMGKETFLLGNENLANTSLGDLLQACRTVLGHTLSDDDELVLGVQELDLYICEDSTPAFSTRFSELLDCYVQLHKNDGNHNPDPFVVTLRTQTRFTNRLNLITQAIAEGKGFSELSFLEHAGFPNEEDFGDEYFSEDHLSPEQQVQTTEQEEQQDQDQQPVEHEAKDQDSQQNDISREQPTEEHEPQQQQQDHQDEQHDANNAEDYVSFDAAPQHDENVEPAKEAENQIQGDSVHEDTQYYESYEDVGNQAQNNDPPTAHATQDQAPEEFASVGGDLDDPQHDVAAQDAIDEDVAQAIEEVDEIPPPPEDEQFDEDFEEDNYQAEEAATEQGPPQTDNVVDEYSFEDDEAQASVFEMGNSARATEASSASSITLEAGHEVQSNNDDEQQQQAEQDTIDLGNDLGVDETVNQGKNLTTEVGDGQHDSGASTGLVAEVHGAKPEYDPDYIDFDDDEDFEKSAPSKEIQEVDTAQGSPSGSPSTKRSYSERNEVEDLGADGQALKKVRSS